jgi:hypothetical protein
VGCPSSSWNHSDLALSLIFCLETLPGTSKKTQENAAMTENTPLPPLPNTPSIHGATPKSLNLACCLMLLDPSSIAAKEFNNEWGSADTEDAIALSSLKNVWLKA